MFKIIHDIMFLEVLTLDKKIKFYYDQMIKGGKLDDIPKEYQGKVFQKLLCDYVKKTRDISLIPEEYRTLELCEIYFYYSHKLDGIPEEYRMQVCENYYFKNGSIMSIPEDYRSLKICIAYFGQTHDIFKIPERFREDVYTDYFNEHHDIRLIPETYRTEKICDSYFNLFNSNEKADKDILSIYPNGFDLGLVPEKYRTEEMCLYHFRHTYDISLIPKRFITLEMAQRYFDLKHNIDDVPEKFKGQVCMSYFIKTGDLTNIPDKYINAILNDLLNMLTNASTKENILNEFNLNEKQFEDIMEFARSENPELYKSITDILEKNSDDYVDITNERVKFLNDVVSGMYSAKELTKDQKIYFTYHFYAHKPERSLETIWNWMMRYPKDNKKLILFFRRFLKFKTTNDMANYEVLSLKEQEREKLPSWIRDYNLESKMGQDERPVTIHFMRDGEDVVINKEEVVLILTILRKNEVPIKNCIVSEAIRQYAVGDLNEFIEGLQESFNVKKKGKVNSKK